MGPKGRTFKPKRGWWEATNASGKQVATTQTEMRAATNVCPAAQHSRRAGLSEICVPAQRESSFYRKGLATLTDIGRSHARASQRLLVTVKYILRRGVQTIA